MDRPHANLIDLCGKKFARLTVVRRAPREKGKPARWVCACDCGNEITVGASNLKTGRTRSCGCYGKERRKESMTTHGYTGSTVYGIWAAMLRRCRNPKVKGYELYGGRGIKVCDEWLSFENFHRDMGDPPAGMSLDRIDVNGNYEPSNCRWATDKEQARNMRTNKHITFNGETKTLVEWCESTGLSYHTVKARLRAGWSPERALTEPVGLNDGRFKAGRSSSHSDSAASV